MTYIYEKVQEELRRKMKGKEINLELGIDVNIIKDTIQSFRIPKRDTYEVLNEMEKEGLITRQGNKIKIRR